MPRKLPPQAATKLIEEIEPLAHARIADSDHQITAAIFAASDTAEAHLLADQIAAAFSAAGFAINRYPVMYGENYILAGVGVLTSNLPEAIERGTMIQNALAKSGLATIWLPTREASTGDGSGTEIYNLGVSVAVGDRI